MADETPKAELMIDIMNNNISVDDVKKRIQQLEEEYGENYMLDYDLEEAGIERKPQNEWTEEYYEKVKEKGILGISSKQYFLYFAELNQYIKNKRQEEQKEQQKEKTTKLIVAAVIVVAAPVASEVLFSTLCEVLAVRLDDSRRHGAVLALSDAAALPHYPAPQRRGLR